MRFLRKTALIAAAILCCMSLTAQSSLKRANKQYELKAFNLAIKSYQKVLARKENDVRALTGIANSYYHLNQMTQAAEYYGRAAQQRKVDYEVFLNYGKTLKAIGQYEEAKKWFNRYAQKYPNDGKQYAASCDFAIQHRNDAPLFELNNEYINSGGSDFGATMFGTNVIYSSSRNDILSQSNQNLPANTGNQLYATSRDGSGFLNPPAFLHQDFKSNYNQGPVAYSSDGRYVAITKNNFVEGTRQIPSSGIELSLFIGDVTQGAEWRNARAFPFNGSGYSTGYATFSPDGNAIYFASDRPDGFGGFDIYVSRRNGNTWSAPENLGAVVNSPGNEISPFFDGSSLYFSSDWHQGFGGYDIFRAEKAGSQWSSIYHTGAGINSPRDDYGFSFDRMTNTGYITSNRVNGKGLEDIYRISKLTDAIVLRIVDEATGQGIPNAMVDFSSCGEGVYSTDAQGNYSFQAMNGLNCTPVIRKDGYMSTSFRLNSADIANRKDFSINLRKVGAGYNGRIINLNTNVALPNVTIRAINQKDNSTTTALTDGRGEYVLQLAPNTPYLIRFSKEGYIDASRTIRTGSGSDLSILGTTSITPTSGGYTGGNSGGYTGNNNGNSNSGGYNGNSGTSGNSGSSGSSGNSGGYTGNNSGNSGGAIRSGYAVQIAALSSNKPLNLSSHQSRLSDLGDVYYTPTGNVNKIRLGSYATREDAKRAQQQALGRGYDGAFIVQENGSTSFSGNGSSGSNTISGNTSSGNNYTGSSPYVVRIAAYSNPDKYFDETKILDVGRLEKQYNGQYTIMLLTGYNTFDEASRAMRKAQSRGFKDAYIMQNIGGTLKKVK